MVVLSITSEHALRAMVYLAEHIDDWPLPGRTIAQEASIPHKYLSAILSDLARAGVLNSSPGPGGGFSMARLPEEIMLAEVVAPFEPLPVKRSPCPFGNADCDNVDPCAAHERWQKVRETYSSFLEETSVFDATYKRRNRRASGSPKRTKR